MNIQKIFDFRKLKIIIAIIIIISTYSCEPDVIFTEEQFIGHNSDTSIPEKWHGQWPGDENVDSCYISKDSFSIGGLNYKIINSKLKLGLDSADGDDKLIFKDDWCFMAHRVDSDSVLDLDGFQILIGNIDNEGNINCWEMTFDYFLKNRLISKVPVTKLVYSDITKNEFYQRLEPRVIYFDIPEYITGNQYDRLIKKIITDRADCPFICEKSYDFDFYKKVAQSRTPDLILTKNKKIIKREKNKDELYFEKIIERNSREKYMKMLLSN